MSLLSLQLFALVCTSSCSKCFCFDRRLFVIPLAPRSLLASLLLWDHPTPCPHLQLLAVLALASCLPIRSRLGLPGTRNLLHKLATPLDPGRISTTSPLGTQYSPLLSALLSPVVSCCLLWFQPHRFLLNNITRLDSFKHACHKDRRRALRLACSRRLCLKSRLTVTLRDADTGCWLGFARRVYSTLSVTRRTGALELHFLRHRLPLMKTHLVTIPANFSPMSMESLVRFNVT